jgi:hypothetical protein
MPELSNLLRQRLEAGETVSPAHPDADMLTAYVEQLLPSAERRSVTAHLSVCAECREVVILSLPQAPTAVRQGSVAIPGSFWKRLWTPGLRWAGAMAVVAVAVTLVVELPRRQQSMRSELTQPQAKQPQGAPSESARDEQEPKPSLAAEPAIIPNSSKHLLTKWPTQAHRCPGQQRPG